MNLRVLHIEPEGLSAAEALSVSCTASAQPAAFYPNPVHDIAHFSVVQHQLRVYNVYGECVYEQTECTEVSLRFLAQGLYMLVGDTTTWQCLKD